MAYKLAFGTYLFPQTFRPSDVGGAQDLGEQPRPRAAGAVSQAGRKQPGVLQVKGELTADTPDALDALELALKCAVFGGKQSLYFGRDDRYYPGAQCKGFSASYQDGLLFGVMGLYALTFEADDTPYQVAASGAVTDGVGPTGGTVTNAGEAPAFPAWTLVVGTGGTGTITLTNTTTSEAATVTGTFVGSDVIVLDRSAYATGAVCTLNGAARFDLFDGRVPVLNNGSNTITVAATGGIVLTSLNVAYTPRYD